MASSRGVAGSLSPHFVAREFACPHCQTAVVRAKLVSALEELRSRAGKPIHVVSGYRCPVHNAAVGGAINSMHMYGAAADLLPGIASPALAHACGFTGVGRKGPWAVHVDVRDGARADWSY